MEATVHSYIAGMADMDPAQANRSAELAAQILDRPDVHPDPEHLACALLERAFHCLLRGEPAAADDLDRGLRLRTGTGTTFVARRSQEVAERCLFHYGRLAEARELDEAEYRRLIDRGEFGLLPPMAQTLSVLTQLAGDWPAARRYANECVDLVAQGAEELAGTGDARHGPHPRAGRRPRRRPGGRRTGPGPAGGRRRPVGGGHLLRAVGLRRDSRSRTRPRPWDTWSGR